jgi:DNA-binding NtrC family response regulator
MKILAVDDDGDWREIMSDCLMGHDLETASDLQTGISRVNEVAFDLVVTDWRLGSVTSREIVELCLEKGLKVVVETVEPEKRDLDVIRNKVEVLDKGTMVKDLRRVVEEVSQSRRER